MNASSKDNARTPLAPDNENESACELDRSQAYLLLIVGGREVAVQASNVLAVMPLDASLGLPSGPRNVSGEPSMILVGGEAATLVRLFPSPDPVDRNAARLIILDAPHSPNHCAAAIVADRVGEVVQVASGPASLSSGYVRVACESAAMPNVLSCPNASRLVMDADLLIESILCRNTQSQQPALRRNAVA